MGFNRVVLGHCSHWDTSTSMSATWQVAAGGNFWRPNVRFQTRAMMSETTLAGALMLSRSPQSSSHVSVTVATGATAGPCNGRSHDRRFSGSPH